MTTHDPGLADQAKAKSTAKPKAKKPPMKETQADKDVRTAIDKKAKQIVLSFCERFEEQNEIISLAKQAQKEVMAEAQSQGYSVKAIKTVIKERARDPNDVADELAVTDQYRDLLGML